MDEKTAWAMFYSGIVAFQYHPRNEPAERMTLRACGYVADLMLEEWRERWPGSQHSSPASPQ